MQVNFNLTESEVNLLATLLKYPKLIEEKVIETDDEGFETEVTNLIENPVSKQQYVHAAFVAYKDKWIKEAVKAQVHIVAKQTEKDLTNESKLDLIVEAVKASGIENLTTILKGQL